MTDTASAVIAPAGAYAEAQRVMNKALSMIAFHTGDPTTAAYMAARLALLDLRARGGGARADRLIAELAADLGPVVTGAVSGGPSTP